jgi:hypothetical protein
MDDRRKWLLLGGLLGVLFILVAFRLISAPEPQRVALKFKSGQTSTATATADTTGVPRIIRPKQTKPVAAPMVQRTNIFSPLGLDRQEQPRGRLKTIKATPARPQAVVTAEMFGPERPAPVVPPPATPPPPSPEETAAQHARQQREAAAQQARQRLGQYRFMGYLTEGGEHRAFLGKGRELYIVRTGETVEGRVRVNSIEPSGVKLTDADTGIGTMLPLAKEAGGPS